MSLADRFCRERWNLGIVSQSVADIARRGIVTPIQWLPDRNRWEFLADPACYSLDGQLVMLAEHLDYWNERGEIWAAIVPKAKSNAIAQIAQFRPWLRANFHLSYPFPFFDGDTLYMICESYQAGGVFLWRKDKDWLLIDKILDQPAVDATIWKGPDRWWLFCGLARDVPNEALYIYHAARPEGPWFAHVGNPVKRDVASSRPAGPLFRYDRLLIRPTQDCSQTYGGAITLNVVETLNKEVFSEYPLRQLKPDRHYHDGLHTICAAGAVTIIDGKYWDTFQPLDVARKLVVPVRKRLRRFTKPQWPNSVRDVARENA